MTLSGKKLFTVCGIAGIILVIILASLLMKPGYENVVKNYYRAIESDDPELYGTKVLPEFVSRYIAEGSGEEYVLKHLERDLKEFREGVTGVNEYSQPIKLHISYSIKNTEKLSDREMYDLMDHLYERFGYFVFHGKDDMEKHITDAVKLFVYYTVTSEWKNVDMYYPDGLILIKEDGKWRLSPD